MAIFMGVAGMLLAMPERPRAQEDHSGLTRAAYRARCLMCHSRAAPEGVSREILAGLHPEPGLKPAIAMPGVSCWRRCTSCWPAERREGRK
ncbi:hypothetical protein [Sphingobium yanoikuyae]|nr:hypothetical protein [Sphingobium yanoikuyae]